MAKKEKKNSLPPLFVGDCLHEGGFELKKCKIFGHLREKKRLERLGSFSCAEPLWEVPLTLVTQLVKNLPAIWETWV